MYDLPPNAPDYETEYAMSEDVSRVLTNRCVLSRQTLTEAMSLALKTPFFRVLRVLEPCLMAVTLALLIWASVKALGLTPVLFYGFLLAALIFFYLQQFVFYPRKAVKNQLLRQALDEGNREPVNYLYFTERNIANRRGEAEELLHMPYEKIRRVMESPRWIVLITKSKNAIPLDQSGFTNGTAADLRRLIAEKAPQADWKKL